MVSFKEDGHIYESINGEPIKWTSVTTLIHKYTNKFDEELMAKKCSTNKKSKWYGMNTADIKKEWKRKNEYANKKGTWYHNMMENEMLQHNTIDRKGVTLEIIKPIISSGIKIAPEQKLKDGVYPEHFVYLKSAGVCGQSDRVEVIQGIVDVEDHKTNEEIKFRSYSGWDGPKMMLAPLSHLEDCNWVHYCLQLSLYMFMVLKHNPHLKPGKITINHVLFEVAGYDQFDNPIYSVDHQGNFIIKDIVRHDVPYMKKEATILLNEYLKNKN